MTNRESAGVKKRVAVLLRERVGHEQSDGEPVREEEAVHASLLALSRTRRDFAGHSLD